MNRSIGDIIFTFIYLYIYIGYSAIQNMKQELSL